MTSKLLHAIVGVGIALGAGAGCGGSSTSEATDSGTPPDGGPGDAGPDLSKFDPFCDSTWPTTKGTPGPPACVDPMNECDPATRQYCTKQVEGAHCDGSRYSPFCIDKEWVCHPTLMRAEDCRCWGMIPPGFVCTDMGWTMVDGGAG